MRAKFHWRSCVTPVGVSYAGCNTIGGDLNVGDAFARVEGLVTVSDSE